MNNAQFTMEEVGKPEDTQSSALRKRETELLEIIEALQGVSSSNLWKVLHTNVFEVELARSKKRLEVESDTTEIFRLQGETRLGRRYHLEQLAKKYRNELQAVKKQLYG